MCSKINHSFASSLCRTVCMLLALLTVGSLCFLPGNVGEASAATKKVTIPDPAEYFGKVVDTDSGASYIAYYFDGYSSFPESKIDSYVKALKNVGLTAVSTSNSGNIINLNYDGDFGVQISWSKQSKNIRVNVVQPLTISSSTSTTTTTTTTAATTTTEKRATIPSPGDYFGGVDKTNPGNKWTVYYCNGHSSYPKSAMESYIKALKNAGLTGGTVSKQSNGDMLAKLNYNGVHVVSVRWYKKDK